MTLRSRLTQIQQKLGSSIEKQELRHFFRTGHWPKDSAARRMARSWARCLDQMYMTVPCADPANQREMERRYAERQRLIDEALDNDRPFDANELPSLHPHCADPPGLADDDEPPVTRRPPSPFQASTPSQT